MAWYRCEARGEAGNEDGSIFAVTRFIEADAETAAVIRARQTIGRELVRRGTDPLDAESRVAIERVVRIDEDDVPGIAPDMIWSRKR